MSVRNQVCGSQVCAGSVKPWGYHQHHLSRHQRTAFRRSVSRSNVAKNRSDADEQIGGFMTLTGEGLLTARAGFEDQQLLSRMGIQITRCDSSQVEGTMPVEGNRQPIGILHGGANAVLAETLGSLAALVYAESGRGGQAVGLDLSCTHHRWVLSGLVRGVCTPLHQGLTTATYDIRIVDETGHLTCSARLTCAIVRARTNK